MMILQFTADHIIAICVATMVINALNIALAIYNYRRGR